MAMKQFSVGDPLGSADVNEYLVNTIWVPKTGATTISSSTAFANDPDLTTTLAPSKTYFLEATIVFTSPSAAGFKCAFNFPAGALFVGYCLFSTISGGQYSNTFSTAGGAATLSGPVVAGSLGGSLDDFVAFRGLLQTLGTGGGFTFKWAQNISNGGSTIVRDKSSMLLNRVA
jgi:hypothetical protein